MIKSKAAVTCKEYGENYFLIGPYTHRNAQLEVEVQIPTFSPIQRAISELNRYGIKVIYGKWLIEGCPNVLLIDLGSAFYKLNEWKADFYNLTGISSGNDLVINDCIVFGYVTNWMLELIKFHLKNTPIILHFHEWMAGVACVLAQKKNLDACTIFTTHATLLGRYLCAGSVDFYNTLKSVNVDYEAGKRGIYERYCLERAAAHSATVFTTVSHITAFEAEHLLKRKPDGVLPNGLSVTRFRAMHEFQNLHAENKEKIHNFVQGHFHGHFDFELEETLYFFIAGRYEYRNKGVDLYIEALSRK